MRKVILAIVVGFVLVGLLVLLGDDSRGIDGVSPVPIYDSPGGQNADTSEAAAALAPTQAEPDAASAATEGASTLDELAQRMNEAEREMRLAQDALNRALELPPDQPISLPPEFDWLSENRSENHEYIQREPVDPTWSATARSQLENLFVDRVDLSEGFGYPTINCRTTRCEAAFVHYEVNERDAVAAARVDSLSTEFFTAIRFRTEIAKDVSQPLIDQFAPIRPEDLDVNIEDGVTTILWHLKKLEQ